MLSTMAYRQSCRAIRSCYALTNLQCSTSSQNTPKPTQSDNNNEETPRTQFPIKSGMKFALRKQKLPPYPTIEKLRELKLENFLSSNFKKVKHGEHTFTECLEGFVHVYIQAYRNDKKLDSAAGYAVFFDHDNALNAYGRVVRRQSLNHGKLYAVLVALKRIPKDSFKKVCICVDELSLISFVCTSLRSMSENSFRSTYTGKLNKDLETSMELNSVLRTRQDLTLRIKYCPNDINVEEIYQAGKLALKGSQMDF